MLWRHAFGRLTYAHDAPSATVDTVFDLASLTKVIATTSLVMRALEAGGLSLDDRITDRLASWRGPDREMVTIADLLEHASGLTAYLPFFRDHQGRVEFERAITTLPLEYAPRTQSIYSDLGFMLLGFVLEDLNGAPLAQQFDAMWDAAFHLKSGFHLKVEATEKVEGTEKAEGKEKVEGKENLKGQIEGRSVRLQAEAHLTFNPPRAWRDRTAPTELDLWRGRLLQGDVHDENTWALGGAAGHAGLFGTAAATGAFARAVLRGLTGRAPSIARPDTLVRFVTKSRVPGSSRALGWDTMLPASSCGQRLSSRAIGHTGFTGTSLWIDPERDVYVVLLTNRVHPTRENNAIQPVRRAFHDAVALALEIDPAAPAQPSS